MIAIFISETIHRTDTQALLAAEAALEVACAVVRGAAYVVSGALVRAEASAEVEAEVVPLTKMSMQTTTVLTPVMQTAAAGTLDIQAGMAVAVEGTEVVVVVEEECMNQVSRSWSAM